jgi:hypothetical protein
MDEMDIDIDIENADLDYNFDTEEQVAEESSEQEDDTANTELEKVLLISETAIANKILQTKNSMQTKAFKRLEFVKVNKYN